MLGVPTQLMEVGRLNSIAVVFLETKQVLDQTHTLIKKSWALETDAGAWLQWSKELYTLLFVIPAVILSPFATFLIILGFIGGAEIFFQKKRAWVRYLVDASYWIYIVHLFIVFTIAEIILRNEIDAEIIWMLKNLRRMTRLPWQ